MAPNCVYPYLKPSQNDSVLSRVNQSSGNAMFQRIIAQTLPKYASAKTNVPNEDRNWLIQTVLNKLPETVLEKKDQGESASSFEESRVSKSSTTKSLVDTTRSIEKCVEKMRAGDYLSRVNTPSLIHNEEVSEGVASLLLLGKEETKLAKKPESPENTTSQSCYSSSAEIEMPSSAPPQLKGKKSDVEHPSLLSEKTVSRIPAPKNKQSKRSIKKVNPSKKKIDSDIISDYDFLKSQEVTSGITQSKPIETKGAKASKKKEKKAKTKALAKDDVKSQRISGTKRKRPSLAMVIDTPDTRKLKQNMLHTLALRQEALQLNDFRNKKRSSSSQQSGLQQVQDIIQRAKEAARSSSPSEILRRAISVQKNTTLLESTNKEIMDQALKASADEIMNEALKAYKNAVQSDKKKQQDLHRSKLTLPISTAGASAAALNEEEILKSARAALRESMSNSLTSVSTNSTYKLRKEYNKISTLRRLSGMKEEVKSRSLLHAGTYKLGKEYSELAALQRIPGMKEELKARALEKKYDELSALRRLSGMKEELKSTALGKEYSELSALKEKLKSRALLDARHLLFR